MRRARRVVDDAAQERHLRPPHGHPSGAQRSVGAMRGRSDPAAGTSCWSCRAARRCACSRTLEPLAAHAPHDVAENEEIDVAVDEPLARWRSGTSSAARRIASSAPRELDLELEVRAEPGRVRQQVADADLPLLDLCRTQECECRPGPQADLPFLDEESSMLVVRATTFVSDARSKIVSSSSARPRTPRPAAERAVQETRSPRPNEDDGSGQFAARRWRLRRLRASMRRANPALSRLNTTLQHGSRSWNRDAAANATQASSRADSEDIHGALVTGDLQISYSTAAITPSIADCREIEHASLLFALGSGFARASAGGRPGRVPRRCGRGTAAAQTGRVGGTVKDDTGTPSRARRSRLRTPNASPSSLPRRPTTRAASRSSASGSGSWTSPPGARVRRRVGGS